MHEFIGKVLDMYFSFLKKYQTKTKTEKRNGVFSYELLIQMGMIPCCE